MSNKRDEYIVNWVETYDKLASYYVIRENFVEYFTNWDEALSLYKTLKKAEGRVLEDSARISKVIRG